MSEDTLDDPMDALDPEDQDGPAGEIDDGRSSRGGAEDGDVEDEASSDEHVDGEHEASSEEDVDADHGASSEGSAEESGDEVDELRSELGQREERIEELEDRLKRVQADFENYKKRAERKREEFAQYATVDLISELLAVRDDLDRALDSEGDIRDGVELVAEELDAILEGEGVERIAAEGSPDPERHEVMMQVDDADAEEGAIVEVYEPGYRMEERVIRPAKVTVASGDGDDGDG